MNTRTVACTSDFHIPKQLNVYHASTPLKTPALEVSLFIIIYIGGQSENAEHTSTQVRL